MELGTESSPQSMLVNLTCLILLLTHGLRQNFDIEAETGRLLEIKRKKVFGDAYIPKMAAGYPWGGFVLLLTDCFYT